MAVFATFLVACSGAGDAAVVSSPASRDAAASPTEAAGPVQPFRGLTGIASWIDGKPLTIGGQLEQGRVVLIDFWTYTCINCIRTMPFLREWHAKYAERGLTIIGVHTPEFDFEHVRDNVVAAARLRGLEYPIAQDNDYATWTSSRIDSGRRSI
ncbi:MAG: redoxin family protein [Dehalococcoidia bacterium]|jgi:thiol-disulfide isomerase/thioredoxin|nr:redoxin family protein [Dehalococcoidia bacterium]